MKKAIAWVLVSTFINASFSPLYASLEQPTESSTGTITSVYDEEQARLNDQNVDTLNWFYDVAPAINQVAISSDPVQTLEPAPVVVTESELTLTVSSVAYPGSYTDTDLYYIPAEETPMTFDWAVYFDPDVLGVEDVRLQDSLVDQDYFALLEEYDRPEDTNVYEAYVSGTDEQERLPSEILLVNFMPDGKPADPADVIAMKIKEAGLNPALNNLVKKAAEEEAKKRGVNVEDVLKEWADLPAAALVGIAFAHAMNNGATAEEKKAILAALDKLIPKDAKGRADFLAKIKAMLDKGKSTGNELHALVAGHAAIFDALGFYLYDFFRGGSYVVAVYVVKETITLDNGLVIRIVARVAGGSLSPTDTPLGFVVGSVTLIDVTRISVDADYFFEQAKRVKERLDKGESFDDIMKSLRPSVADFLRRHKDAILSGKFTAEMFFQDLLARTMIHEMVHALLDKVLGRIRVQEMLLQKGWNEVASLLIEFLIGNPATSLGGLLEGIDDGPGRDWRSAQFQYALSQALLFDMFAAALGIKLDPIDPKADWAKWLANRKAALAKVEEAWNKLTPEQKKALIKKMWDDFKKRFGAFPELPDVSGILDKLKPKPAPKPAEPVKPAAPVKIDDAAFQAGASPGLDALVAALIKKKAPPQGKSEIVVTPEMLEENKEAILEAIRKGLIAAKLDPKLAEAIFEILKKKAADKKIKIKLDRNGGDVDAGIEVGAATPLAPPDTAVVLATEPLLDATLVTVTEPVLYSDVVSLSDGFVAYEDVLMEGIVTDAVVDVSTLEARVLAA